MALLWTNTQPRLSQFVSLVKSFIEVFFIKKPICNSFAVSNNSGAHFTALQYFLSYSQHHLSSVTDTAVCFVSALDSTLSLLQM